MGGNNKVDMKMLKAAFEEMGFFEVSTYINSGNVIFSAKDPSDVDVEKLGQYLEKTFGFPIRTLIRTAADIKKVCSVVPEDWSNNKEQKTDVLFLWKGYDSKKSINLIKTDPKVDNLLYVAGSIVWHIDRRHYNQSGMNKFIGTEVYKHMTARNINTVRKLMSLMV